MIFYRVLGLLPLRVLYTVAGLIYYVIYYLVGYRKEVVRENLVKAFPDKNETEVTVLSKMFYRQLTDVAMEIIKARQMSKADFCERITLCNPQLLDEVSRQSQRSVIILAVHQGNWEWMLHGITAAMDIRVDPIYKQLHNSAADKLIFEIRSQFGARPVSLKESARNILRHRREFRCLGMLADQAPTPGERGHWTSFMNQSAAFHLGAESIAKLTEFPVVFAQCQRVSRGYYEVEFHSLGEPPYDDPEGVLTQRYVELAEQAIRQEPQSWLWSNRRWKRSRIEDTLEPGN
ncbi:MAG: KDO2-lipid IV(A) lauroyltransferase [Halioglobus sp.]|jgi:KDO2-lipid IV(A) lauroyltransferase